MDITSVPPAPLGFGLDVGQFSHAPDFNVTTDLSRFFPDDRTPTFGFSTRVSFPDRMTWATGTVHRGTVASWSMTVNGDDTFHGIPFATSAEDDTPRTVGVKPLAAALRRAGIGVELPHREVLTVPAHGMAVRSVYPGRLYEVFWYDSDHYRDTTGGLLSPAELPAGFTYPEIFLRVYRKGLTDLGPWQLLNGTALRTVAANLRTDPVGPADRDLYHVPFARRHPDGAVACWRQDGTVTVTGGPADSGRASPEGRMTFDGWLRSAFDTLLDSLARPDSIRWEDLPGADRPRITAEATAPLPADELPEGFTCPEEFLRLLDLGITDLQPWLLYAGQRQLNWSKNLHELLPDPPLLPLAGREDRDDLVCWNCRTGRITGLDEDFYHEGRRSERTYDGVPELSFLAWFPEVIDDFITCQVEEADYWENLDPRPEDTDVTWLFRF